MRKALATLGIAVSCALGVAGCSQGTTAQQVQSSQQTTQQSSSQGGSQVLVAAYTNTMKVKTAKISMTIDTVSDGKNSESKTTGAVQFDPPAADLVTQSNGISVEARVVNGATYYSAPGGKWTKLDLSKVTGNSPQQVDPNQALKYLQGASDDVQGTGPTAINGGQATGYKVTVNLDKVAEQYPTPQFKQRIQALEKLIGSKTIPMTMWIDGQGRLAREEFSITVPQQGHNTTLKNTTDFTDYGTPVKVEEPSKDQIVS